MPAATIDPGPQYTPRKFAHGILPDRAGGIPSICFYKIPEGHTEAEMLIGGYFGPQQYRPSVKDSGAAGATNSTNQGQPSLGSTVAFGSMILFTSSDAVPSGEGLVTRINDTNGYGLKPGETEVHVSKIPPFPV